MADMSTIEVEKGCQWGEALRGAPWTEAVGASLGTKLFTVPASSMTIAPSIVLIAASFPGDTVSHHHDYCNTGDRNEDPETSIERRFLLNWFQASTSAEAISHLRNTTAFWTRTASCLLARNRGCDTTKRDDEAAIWHAVVALSAALDLSRCLTQPGKDSSAAVMMQALTRDGLEMFVLRQYNKSIGRLQQYQRYQNGEGVQGVRTTLLCCLAFIFIETLRGNHEIVATHFANGLRIVAGLPGDIFKVQQEPQEPFPGEIGVLLTNPFPSMRDILQTFAQLELEISLLPRYF